MNAGRAPDHPLVGTTIGGKYLIRRVIGQGGMGVVFEAENVVLKRLVALKIVSGEANAEAIQRLEREATLIVAMQHPNVCDLYDFGHMPDGTPYMVLERLFGETLADLLKRKKVLPPDFVVDVFAQILSGLQAAHGAQIVHRDLKPHNVFLVDRLGLTPLVKVVDFGFAKDCSGLRTRTITKPGKMLGTVQYMSPEQLRCEVVDARADIFALGVMLYQSLCGDHPFGSDTLMELHRKIILEPPIPLSRRCRVEPALEAVVNRAIAKEPNHRWQTAAEMQRALLAAAPRSMRAPADEAMPPSSSRS